MEVIICKNCEGHGSFLVNERDGYRDLQCKKCLGTGRLLKRTYTVELPYGTKLPEVDAQISELIKNLNKSNL